MRHSRRPAGGEGPPPFVNGVLPLADPSADVALADLIRLLPGSGEGLLPRAGIPSPPTSTGSRTRSRWEIDTLRVDRRERPPTSWADAPRSGVAGGVVPRHAAAGQLGWRKARRSWNSRGYWRPRPCRCPDRPGARGRCRHRPGPRPSPAGTVSPIFGNRTVSATLPGNSTAAIFSGWIALLALYAHAPQEVGQRCASDARSAANSPDPRPRPPLTSRPRSCCAIWWRCTTSGGRSRSRCRSKPPTPTLRRGSAAVMPGTRPGRWRSNNFGRRRPSAI